MRVRFVNCWVSWVMIELILLEVLMMSRFLGLGCLLGVMFSWLNSIFYVVMVVSGSVVVCVELSVVGVWLMMCLFIRCSLLLVLGCVIEFVY